MSLQLAADCGSCFGLCCVALPFAASSDFAIDKAAGDPCPNLQEDFRCRIHDRLRNEGFSGCTTYYCFGAGQQVSQDTFAGVSWRAAPDTADLMYAVFPVMRQLHELLWYLTDAFGRPAAEPIRADLQRQLTETEQLTNAPAADLVDLDVAALRDKINKLLLRTSELVRAPYPQAKDYRGAQLFGAKLAGADLRGASLRGAYVIGADLSGADLRSAGLIGADLRGAKVNGADLSSSLFLTQMQTNAVIGDARTRIQETLARPSHWGPQRESGIGWK